MRYFLVITLLVLSTNAFAKDGSTGCGPGWYIFKDNSLVSSTLRSITHGILWPVTTLGMTFGTSNCSKHKIVDNSKRSLHYATVSLENLRQDAARGAGQWVEAYAGTFQCSPLASLVFQRSLQKNYDQIFHSENPQHVVFSTINMIEGDHLLRTECQAT